MEETLVLRFIGVRLLTPLPFYVHTPNKPDVLGKLRELDANFEMLTKERPDMAEDETLLERRGCFWYKRRPWDCAHMLE
jgi:hypothetical protein